MSETTFDFGNGPVPATRLDNGAWIASSASVAPSAFVGRGARVATSAIVGPGVYVGSWARVGSWAYVGERANVGSWARVGPGAYVGVESILGDAAIVGPGAYVGERAIVGPGAYVGDPGTIAWGCVLGHDWTAYCVDGEVVLRYGCEIHPLVEWTRALRWRLARKHEPAKAKEYANALRSLVRLVRATVAPNDSLPAPRLLT